MGWDIEPRKGLDALRSSYNYGHVDGTVERVSSAVGSDGSSKTARIVLSVPVALGEQVDDGYRFVEVFALASSKDGEAAALEGLEAGDGVEIYYEVLAYGSRQFLSLEALDVYGKRGCVWDEPNAMPVVFGVPREVFGGGQCRNLRNYGRIEGLVVDVAPVGLDGPDGLVLAIDVGKGLPIEVELDTSFVDVIPTQGELVRATYHVENTREGISMGRPQRLIVEELTALNSCGC